MNLRTVFQRQLVDKSTGEVVTDVEVKVAVPTVGEGFAFVYHQGILQVLALPPLCAQVWLWCCTRMGTGGGQISIGRPERLQIMQACGIKSTTSVSTALAKLIVAGVLKRLSPGRYVMNPDTAWRGRVRTRPIAQQKWKQEQGAGEQ